MNLDDEHHRPTTNFLRTLQLTRHKLSLHLVVDDTVKETWLFDWGGATSNHKSKIPAAML